MQPIAAGTTAPLPNSSTNSSVHAMGVFAAPPKTAANPTPARSGAGRPSGPASAAPSGGPDHEEGRDLAAGKTAPEAHAREDELGQPRQRGHVSAHQRRLGQRQAEADVVPTQQQGAEHDHRAAHGGAQRRVGDGRQRPLHAVRRPDEQRCGRAERNAGDADADHEPRVDLGDELGRSACSWPSQRTTWSPASAAVKAASTAS